MRRGGGKLVCLFQPHFWETGLRVQACCPWKSRRPPCATEGRPGNRPLPRIKRGCHWEPPSPYSPGGTQALLSPQRPAHLKAPAGGHPGPGEELAPQPPGPVGEQFALGTPLRQRGVQHPEQSPTGAPFVPSGEHGNGAHPLIPTSPHLQAGRPLPLTLRPISGPPLPHISARGLLASLAAGAGGTQEGAGTPGGRVPAPTRRDSPRKEGGEEGSSGEEGAAPPPCHRAPGGWGGDPDPSPGRPPLHRKGKLPSNGGWAGMWAPRLGVWNPI